MEKNNYLVEIRKKDDIIIGQTREIRINQSLLESMELKANGDKRDFISTTSH